MMNLTSDVLSSIKENLTGDFTIDVEHRTTGDADPSNWHALLKLWIEWYKEEIRQHIDKREPRGRLRTELTYALARVSNDKADPFKIQKALALIRRGGDVEYILRTSSNASVIEFLVETFKVWCPVALEHAMLEKNYELARFLLNSRYNPKNWELSNMCNNFRHDKADEFLKEKGVY